MKIATITFHWAKNYGAVLQAFALQRFLKKQGCDTELIDYLPRRTMFRTTVAALKNRDISYFKKAAAFKRFKNNELTLSKKKYHTNKSLSKCANEYNAVICGSDQVWNKSFTLHAEGKPTLSYFLNFAGEKTKRISYATSFGSVALPDNMQRLIKPELEKYNAVSVREESAVAMLNDIGIEASLVLDPTLLLEQEDYLALLKEKKYDYESGALTYIIHHNQKTAHDISDYVKSKYDNSDTIKNCDLYEWLYKISRAKVVITNSFHGTVFSLIFHKPFITVAIPGSGMNDRLVTLLKSVGLDERFIEDFDKETVDNLLNTEIDWQRVDTAINNLRNNSETFLKEALK